MGALVQGAEVRAVGRGGDLGAEDYDVEVLAAPVVVGGGEEGLQARGHGGPVE